MFKEPEAVNYPGNNIELNSPDGGKVFINPYGAHVLSWVTAGGNEQLFLSPKAEFRAGVAIRGGVPVVFPQFAGLGNLPKHGFARTSSWKVRSVNANNASFYLSESDAMHGNWPYKFLAEYVIQIKNNQLEMELFITNTDSVPFTFTAALHTYLQVKSLEGTVVQGLSGLMYRDSTKSGIEVRETSDLVAFTEELDRIYLDAPADLRLVASDKKLTIGSEGFPDAVIWNPGLEKCAQLNDMEADGYQHFVCVEAAVIGKPVLLASGAIWRGKQFLAV